MKDLLLTKESGFLDIKFVNGDLQLVEGPDGDRQALEFKFEFFQNDWALDLAFGIPYFGGVLGTGVNASALVGIFHQAAIEEPYVESVESLTVEADPITRQLSVLGSFLGKTGKAIELNFSSEVT